MALATRLLGMLLLAVSAAAETSNSAATGVTIEIRRAPGLEPERYTLGCEPPTGTVPDPVTACRRVAALVEDAGPPSYGRIDMPLPGSIVCEAVYGGPEVLVVRGWLAGHPIAGRYTREDGCDMSGYDQMVRALGVPAWPARHEAAGTL